MFQSKILHTRPDQKTQNIQDYQPQTTSLNPLPSIKQYRARKNSINSEKKPNLSHYLSAPELSLMPSQASSHHKSQQEIQSTFHTSTAQADSTCILSTMLAVPTSSFSSSIKADRNSQPLKTSKSQNKAAVVTNFPLITKSATGFKSMLFLTPPKIGTRISSSIKETKATLHLSSTCSHQSNTQSSSFIHDEHSQDVAVKSVVHAFTLDQNHQSEDSFIDKNEEEEEEQESNSNQSLNSETDGEGLAVASSDEYFKDIYNKKKRRKQQQQQTGDESMSEWDNKFNSLLQSPTISNKYSALGQYHDNQNFTKSIQQNHFPKINVQLCDQPQKQQQQLVTQRNQILSTQFSNKGLLASGFNSEGKNNYQKTLSFNHSAPLLPKLQNCYQQSNVQAGQAYLMSAGSRKNGNQIESHNQYQEPFMDIYQNSSNNSSTSNLLQLASNLISFQNTNNSKLYSPNQSNQQKFCENISGDRKARSQYKGSFNFPDGGWVCCMCQNYNFYGRAKCNRCGKVKSKMDVNGKPRHLVKKQIQYFNQNQQCYANNPDCNNICPPNQQQQQHQQQQYQQQYSFPTEFISSPTNNSGNIKNNLIQDHTSMIKNEKISIQQHQQSQQQQLPNQLLQNGNPHSFYQTYNHMTNNAQILHHHHHHPQLPVQLSLQQQQLQQQRSYKKPLTQRIGDWICLNCRNLNFSFRVVCNRCNLSRQMYGQYVNKEAQLMLPSINSPSSSSSASSSHNIPTIGMSAPQLHSHYFNANNFNFNSPTNNQDYSNKAGMKNGQASVHSFSGNIFSPAFCPLNTGKQNDTRASKKRSSNDQQQEEENQQEQVQSKGMSEQQQKQQQKLKEQQQEGH